MIVDDDEPLVTLTRTSGDPEGGPALARPELPVVADDAYELGEEVGRGGLGRVRSARHRWLRRSVALKELLPGRDDDDSVSRFLREALLTARLQHPSIVPVYEAGRWRNGMPFYAMKLANGRTLAALIEERRTLAERMALLPHVVAAVDAVAYAHSENVLHRDLKPSNVLVGAFGETLVIDWGLGKDVSDAEPAADTQPPLVASGTVTGRILGTPAYMPPEQAEGEVVDESADVYALGAMLYHVLSGAPPYSGRDVRVVLERVRLGPPRPLAAIVPELATELIAIVEKAMAREPADRYASAGELASDLKRFQTGQLVSAHRYTLATLVKRWVRRHRGVVAVGALSFATLLVIGTVSVLRIVRAEARTQAALVVAEDQRGQARDAQAAAESRTRDLLGERARELLPTDPARCLALLREFLNAGGDPRWARIFAGAAWSRGAAKQVLRGHRGQVDAVRFFPDGQRVASASWDHDVRIWDLATGRTQQLSGHDSGVHVLAISPDGRHLVSKSFRGAMRLWDSATGNGYPIPADFDPAYSTPVFTPDGRTLLSEQSSGLVTFDLNRGIARVVFERARSPWALSPDGNTIVAATSEGVLMGSLSGGPARPLADATKAHAMIWSPDGRRIALQTYDGVELVFSARGEAQARLAESPVLGVIAFSPDGSRLARAGFDGSLRIWDIDSGKSRELARFPDGLEDVLFSPDGQRLVTRGKQGDVVVWGPEDGSRRELGGRGIHALSIALSSEGRRLAAGFSDGTVRVWDLADGLPRVLSSASYPETSGAAPSPDGTKLAVVAKGGQVVLIDRATGSRTILGLIPTTNWTRPPTVIYGPDGRTVTVAVPADGSVRSFVVAPAAAPPRRIDVGAIQVLTYVDSHTVAMATSLTVTLWDIESGTSRMLEGHEGSVSVVAAATGQGLVASGDARGVIRLWRLPDGAPVKTLEGHQQAVSALAFSPDGKLLASGSFDTDVRLWDVASGKVGVLSGHWREVLVLAFSPDGRTLASGADDHQLFLWDVGGAKSRTLIGHDNSVTAVAFSPDGRRLASGSADHTVRLWDLATEESRSIRHAGTVRSVWFTPDGRDVISAGDDVLEWSDDLPWDAPGLTAWIDAHTDERAR